MSKTNSILATTATTVAMVISAVSFVSLLFIGGEAVDVAKRNGQADKIMSVPEAQTLAQNCLDRHGGYQKCLSDCNEINTSYQHDTKQETACRKIVLRAFLDKEGFGGAGE